MSVLREKNGRWKGEPAPRQRQGVSVSGYRTACRPLAAESQGSGYGLCTNKTFSADVRRLGPKNSTYSTSESKSLTAVQPAFQQTLGRSYRRLEQPHMATRFEPPFHNANQLISQGNRSTRQTIQVPSNIARRAFSAKPKSMV